MIYITWVSAFFPANSLNLSTDLKSRSRHPKKDVYLVLVYGITEHPMMLVTNTITLLLFTHLLYHRLKMLCHLWYNESNTTITKGDFYEKIIFCNYFLMGTAFALLPLFAGGGLCGGQQFHWADWYGCFDRCKRNRSYQRSLAGFCLPGNGRLPAIWKSGCLRDHRFFCQWWLGKPLWTAGSLGYEWLFCRQTGKMWHC